MKPRIVGFMNAYSDGMSGGDACFIEIMKRIDGFDLVVLTSSLGKSVCRERGLDASYWVTSREKEFTRAALTYTARTIRALSFVPRIKNGDILFSSSDFVPDVVPAFVARTLWNKTRWYQRTFHMIPADRFVSHAGQRLSHWLIRWASDHIIPDSELLRQDWIEKGIGANRISVSYPGVDPKTLLAPRRYADGGIRRRVFRAITPIKGDLRFPRHMVPRNGAATGRATGGDRTRYARNRPGARARDRCARAHKRRPSPWISSNVGGHCDASP